MLRWILPKLLRSDGYFSFDVRYICSAFLQQSSYFSWTLQADVRIGRVPMSTRKAIQHFSWTKMFLICSFTATMNYTEYNRPSPGIPILSRLGRESTRRSYLEKLHYFPYAKHLTISGRYLRNVPEIIRLDQHSYSSVALAHIAMIGRVKFISWNVKRRRKNLFEPS